MKKYLKQLFSPIKNSPIAFIFFVILLAIPNYPNYLIDKDFILFKNYIIKYIIQICSLFFVSYLLCLLGYVLERKNKKVGVLYFYVIHFLLYFLSFIEVFLLRNFHLQYEPLVFELINETNSNETSEFFSTYIFSLKTSVVFFVFVFIVVFEYLLSFALKRSCSLKKFISCSLCYFVLSFLLIGICANLYTAFGNVNEIYKIQRFNGYKVNSFYRLYDSFKQLSETKKNIAVLKEQHNKIEIDSCSFRSKNIILIVGESFNKYHSSLYGYYLNTNPYLSSVNGLYIFNDVISPENSTSRCFQKFLSFESTDVDSVKWYNTLFFPSLFKKANYNVIFYSNQFVNTGYADGKAYSGGYYLNYTNIDKACFSYRNSKTYPYDGEMINAYIQERNEIEKDSLNLIIFHLYGQHIAPQSRYPKDFEYFTADSINRPDLEPKHKEAIAYYDNATRYNDYVVKQIIDLFSEKDAIIIYMADHSDEVNDFRLHTGRAYDLSSGNENVVRNQLDIPFLIYVTELYKKSNPDIVNQIENSINLPYMIDDIPHLMLDIAGIEAKWFNPQRSLINPQFNCNRKRMVGRDKNIDYDIVCK